MSIHSFHARQDPHRSRSRWHQQLDCADVESDVLETLRDFMASFTPYEIQALPAELRPRKLFDVSDVAAYAFDLLQAENRDSGNETLRAFADVIAYGSSQLSRVMADPRAGQESA